MWFWAAGPTEDANEFRKLSPFPCLTCNSSSPAPNQHHSFCDLCEESGNTGPLLLSVVFSHIHSKTACRGVSERQWRSAAPVSAAPATKPAETLGFCWFSFCTCCMGMGFTLVQTLGFPIRSHLFPTAATPSSTQNAPDFSYFRLKSGAFRCFCLLLTCKNFVPVFLRHPGFPAIHIDSF